MRDKLEDTLNSDKKRPYENGRSESKLSHAAQEGWGTETRGYYENWERS